MIKERTVTQHENKRLTIRRGKQGLTRARPLCFKNRGKNVLRGVLGQAHYTKNDSYALEEVLKERMVTQHKKIKDWPFAEGSRD